MKLRHKIQIILGIILGFVWFAIGANVIVTKVHKLYVQDQTSVNRVSVEAPVLGSSYIFKLPPDDGLSGSLLFGDGSGTNAWTANLFWDAVNSRAGVVESTPRQSLSVGANLDLYSGIANSPTQASMRGSTLGNLVINAKTGQDTYINFDTGEHTHIYGAGTERFRFESDGDALFGNAATPKLKWTEASNLLSLGGATSGEVGLKAAAVTTSYNLTFPPAQGAATQTLVNDGSGNLSWGAGGGGGGTPGGNSSDIQYNNGGTFAGSLHFGYRSYDKSPGNNAYTNSLFQDNTLQLSTTNKVGQTFTSTISAASNTSVNLLMKFTIGLGNTGMTDTFTVKIYATSGGLPTGSALATSAPIVYNTIRTASAGSYVNARFVSPIVFSPSTVYAIVLETVTTGTSRVSLKTEDPGLYASGSAIVDSGGGWATNTGDAYFNFMSDGPNAVLAFTGSPLKTGYLDIKIPSSFKGHELTLPSEQGEAGSMLTNNGSGLLTWTVVSAGANTTLSNLVTPTNVNQTLKPDAANSRDLGTISVPWRNEYVQSLQLQNTSAGAIVINPAAGANPAYAITMPAAQGSANTVLTNNGSGALAWSKPDVYPQSTASYTYNGVPATIPDGTTDVVVTSGLFVNTFLTLPIAANNKNLKITFREFPDSGQIRYYIGHQAGDFMMSTNWLTNGFYLRFTRSGSIPEALQSRYNAAYGIWTWEPVNELSVCIYPNSTTTGAGSPVNIAVSNISGTFDIDNSSGVSQLYNLPNLGTFSGPFVKSYYRAVFNTQNSAAAGAAFSLSVLLDFLGTNKANTFYLVATDSLHGYSFVGPETPATSNRAATMTRPGANAPVRINTADASWNLNGGTFCNIIASPL